MFMVTISPKKNPILMLGICENKKISFRPEQCIIEKLSILTIQCIQPKTLTRQKEKKMVNKCTAGIKSSDLTCNESVKPVAYALPLHLV